MAIKVRFDKAGFYHPAFGRLGRGKDANRVYMLPDAFGEVETIAVPIMDHTSKPPRQIGERELTRYKNIPNSADVIDEDYVAELEERSEQQGDAEAAAELAEVKAATMQKVATQEALEKVTGGPKKGRAQSASERTTGAPKKSARRRAAPAQE